MCPLEFVMILLGIVSDLSAGDLGVVVFRGESADLHCPDNVEGNNNIFYWYKMEYEVGVTPQPSQAFASYISTTGNVLMAQEYIARGVTLSTTDAHLHFPEVMLSDNGGYTCSVVTTRHHGLDVSVHVRPSGLNISAPEMPVNLNQMYNASCTVDEIRPAPVDFYWKLDGERLDGSIQTEIVDATYNVLRVMNTLTHTVVAENEGKTLSCVLVYDNDNMPMEEQAVVIDVIEITDSSAASSIIPIVAGVIVGVFLLILIIAAVIIVRRRKKPTSKTNGVGMNRLNSGDQPHEQYAEVNKPPGRRQWPVQPPQTETENPYAEPEPPAVPPYNGGVESEYQEVMSNNNKKQPDPPAEVNYAELCNKALKSNPQKLGPPKPPRYQATEYAQVDFDKSGVPPPAYSYDQQSYENENPYYNG